MDRERRCVAGPSEVRANSDATGITGSAAVFGQGTRIHDFDEVIARGAFDGVLKDDIVGEFNHSPDSVLGRTSAGTMKVWADDDGFHYDIPVLPDSRADVLEAVQLGNVRGNSFSFSLPADGTGEEWRSVAQRSDGGKRPLRTITRIAKVYDVGPVTHPAYEQTEVSARSTEKARSMSEDHSELVDDVEKLERDAVNRRIEAMHEMIAMQGRRIDLLEAGVDSLNFDV